MGPRAVDDKKQSMESALTCTKQKLLDDLRDSQLSVLSDLSDGISVTIKGNKVNVQYLRDNQLKSASFELSVPEDRAVFVEL
jgi:hypothetical protein